MSYDRFLAKTGPGNAITACLQPHYWNGRIGTYCGTVNRAFDGKAASVRVAIKLMLRAELYHNKTTKI